MNQSRFLSKQSALQLLKTKLSLQESNIYFNFNRNDMPELTHISIELVDRIVNVANYNVQNYNIRIVGISINTSIHATLFYNGNVGRQEVFITPAELNKFWFDAVDKYEELVSYTNSSKFDVPLLTCFKRSVLPTISFNFLKPSSANISLTSSAIKVNKFTTFSGVPVNFFLKFSSWVQTPTGQVLE